jgi:hypothetical protein
MRNIELEPARTTPRRQNTHPDDIRPSPGELSDNERVKTVGNRTISAWMVEVDVVRFQLRCPELARQVSRLAGAKRVDRGGRPYLRLYEVPGDFRWATDYVERAIIRNN